MGFQLGPEVVEMIICGLKSRQEINGSIRKLVLHSNPIGAEGAFARYPDGVIEHYFCARDKLTQEQYLEKQSPDCSELITFISFHTGYAICKLMCCVMMRFVYVCVWSTRNVIYFVDDEDLLLEIGVSH